MTYNSLAGFLLAADIVKLFAPCRFYVHHSWGSHLPYVCCLSTSVTLCAPTLTEAGITSCICLLIYCMRGLIHPCHNLIFYSDRTHFPGLSTLIVPCKNTSGPCLSSRVARAVEGTSTALPCRPAAASAASSTGRAGRGNFFLVSGILLGVVKLGRFANFRNPTDLAVRNFSTFRYWCRYA